MKQLSNEVDICMSHDWPRGIHKYGNEQQLLKFKPYFRDDIENDRLGNPKCYDLLMHMKPKYWFSAHLHCQFSAVISHDDTDKETKFLALDKCLPKRRFLQILDVDSEDGDVKMSYDLEWLTILSETNDLSRYDNLTNYMPDKTFTPTDVQKTKILEKFKNNLVVPMNFCRTVEPYNPNNRKEFATQQIALSNPQTTAFCDKLGIDDPISLALHVNGHELNHSTYIDSSMNNDSFMSSTATSDSSFNTSSEVTPLKRKSLLDSLPPPNSSSCSINPDELGIDEEFDLLVEDISFKLPVEDNSGTDGMNSMLECSTLSSSTEKDDSLIDDSSLPLKKKFKRRNASIYDAISEE